MGETENRRTLERLQAVMSSGDMKGLVDAADELYTSDVVEEWPQSGPLPGGVAGCRSPSRSLARVAPQSSRWAARPRAAGRWSAPGATPPAGGRFGTFAQAKSSGFRCGRAPRRTILRACTGSS